MVMIIIDWKGEKQYLQSGEKETMERLDPWRVYNLTLTTSDSEKPLTPQGLDECISLSFQVSFRFPAVPNLLGSHHWLDQGLVLCHSVPCCSLSPIYLLFTLTIIFSNYFSLGSLH